MTTSRSRAKDRNARSIFWTSPFVNRTFPSSCSTRRQRLTPARTASAIPETPSSSRAFRVLVPFILLQSWQQVRRDGNKKQVVYTYSAAGPSYTGLFMRRPSRITALRAIPNASKRVQVTRPHPYGIKGCDVPGIVEAVRVGEGESADFQGAPRGWRRGRGLRAPVGPDQGRP